MHWHASPRSAVGFLMHAASLDARQLGPRINLTMPGVACTVGEQIAALRRVAGDKVVARIRREPDAAIMQDRLGLADAVRPQARAARSGFKVENTSTRSSACISTTNWAARSRRSRERPEPRKHGVSRAGQCRRMLTLERLRRLRDLRNA